MVSMVKTRAERKEGVTEGGQTEGSHGERKPTFSECWRFIDDLKAHVKFTDDKEEQFSLFAVGILVDCGWDCSETITRFTEDFPDVFAVHKKSLPKCIHVESINMKRVYPSIKNL